MKPGNLPLQGAKSGGSVSRDEGASTVTLRQRRLSVGIDPLQKGSFPAILCQKATAGVSLAAAFLLVLHRKYLFLKCFAVLRPRFFLAANFEDEAILGVLRGQGESGREKDGCKTE